MAPYKKRERKHKVRKKETKHAGSDHDPNAVEILPPDQATRKRKHEEARENIRSQQPNMSSKKKKRLDHYIVSCVMAWAQQNAELGIGYQIKERREPGIA